MIAARQTRMGRHSITPYVIMSMFFVVQSIWFQWALWHFLVASGDWVLYGGDLPLQMGLFGGFGVAFGAWTTLLALGLVGSGSGAGFRLALLGLGARIFAECLESLEALLIGETSATYGGPLHTVQLMWLVRNGALLAYGYGMTLVLLATVTELRRRQSAPAWTRTAE